jgi:pyridoxine/pyridoxamine 5'-phosphate oxidase
MRVSRPIMPASYGLDPLVADSGLLPWSWADNRLAQARNYWLATCSDSGQPHAVPVWAVWHQRGLIFSTSRASRKAHNLRHNAMAAVHLESGDDVVAMEGHVVALANGLLKDYIATYRKKYGIGLEVDDQDTVHCRFIPSKILAWQESAFPTTATRWLLTDET